MTFLYADENFPLPVVEELRSLGHDVLTIQEDGNANQRFTDEAVLETATHLKRAILTTNRRDFIRLDSLHENHAGIIVCTYDPDFARQARRIDDALKPLESLVGALVRVNRPA